MKRPINWTNTLFLSLTPILGISGTLWLWQQDAIHWQTVVLTIVLSFITGLSITAGYHRLFSHQTYEASPIVKACFALFGLMAFEGSILEWCCDHRTHHRYVDTEKDPYNIKQGFWYAHIGWLLVNQPELRTFKNVTDLQQDPIVMLQHRYVNWISVFIGIFVPTLISGLFWSDWLGGFFIAAMLRITLAQHFTFCINSVCHTFGKKTYSEKQTARDNWFTAFFTFGEGFHNFHHQFPSDYRNGIRYFHYDPSKWLIKFLSYFGLARDLKTVELKQLVSARISFYEKWFKHRESCHATRDFYREFFSPARLKTLKIVSNLEQATKLYKQFTAQTKNFNTKKYLKSYHLRKRIYKKAIKNQKKALSDSLQRLGQLIKQCPSPKPAG